MALNFVSSCFRGIAQRCGRMHTSTHIGRFAGKPEKNEPKLAAAVAEPKNKSKKSEEKAKVQKQQKNDNKGWKKISRKRIKNPFKKSKAKNQKNESSEDKKSVSPAVVKGKLVKTNHMIPEPSTSAGHFPNFYDISNFQRRFLSIPAYNMGRTDDFRGVKSSHSETDTKSAVGLDLNIVRDHKLKDEPRLEESDDIPRFVVTSNDLRKETVVAAKKIWKGDEINKQIDWDHLILNDVVNLQLSKDNNGELIRLGKGQFGTVYRGTYDDRPVAVKFFAKEKAQMKSILEEATLLNLMRNSLVTPRMFGLVSVVEEADEEKFYQWAIVMSYCGTNLDRLVLEERVRKSNGEKTLYSTLDYAEMFYRISICVDAFHRKGIVMNDLKSNNIMIEDVNGLMIPTIIDLGLSFPEGLRVFEYPLPEDERDEFQRRFPHCAPELFNGGTIDLTSDMYSLGVMLADICDELDLYLIGEKGKRCRKVKPNKRPTAAQLANEYQDIIMEVMDRIDPVDYQ